MKKLLLIAVCALLVSWRPPISLSKLSKAKKGLDLVASATHKINEEEEYYIGRAVAANILGQYPLWKNDDVTRYVNLVGNALVLRSAPARNLRRLPFRPARHRRGQRPVRSGRHHPAHARHRRDGRRRRRAGGDPGP